MSKGSPFLGGAGDVVEFDVVDDVLVVVVVDDEIAVEVVVVVVEVVVVGGTYSSPRGMCIKAGKGITLHRSWLTNFGTRENSGCRREYCKAKYEHYY
ncbi:MAG: hypothetical protein ACFFD6_10080 [Candidatus Thorarchaeota archaeon]